jgi:hypothetical protein
MRTNFNSLLGFALLIIDGAGHASAGAGLIAGIRAKANAIRFGA